ncbi:sigma 54-interacting transcriptional regulator, partial [Enterobacter hormaechei]
PRSRELLERIERLAPSEANALVIGETGTGKELVARHIHALSGRSGGPFVAVNCGAFAESLVESELFGHEKGAFTGALQSKAGWFEA